MAKFKISKVRDAETVRTFTFRIRDLYEKYTFEATAKAKDVLEAKQKIKAKLIGWGNMHIMSVKDDQGKQYFGRELITFKDNNTVETEVKDWGGTRNGIIYDWTNGVYTLVHRNGKVEKIPEDKFKGVDGPDELRKLYAYIDSIKDAGIAYIITTKKQDKFFDGKQLNTELKQAKKFDTEEKGIQAAEEAFGSNWDNNLDVITVNSDLSAYASLIKDALKYVDITVKPNNVNEVLKEFSGAGYKEGKDFLRENNKIMITNPQFAEWCRKEGWTSTITAQTIKNRDAQLTEQQIKEFAKQKGLSYVDAKRMLEENSSDENYGESAMWKAMHDAGIEVTQESGTDKILYVMQSNADKNLYFYIGKTYSMKDGEWTYAKYKMNSVSPETIKKDLEANGWHQVSNGPARVIDSIKDSWADDAMQELNKKGKANWNEDDWETYHYIEQARHESGYYEDSAIKDDQYTLTGKQIETIKRYANKYEEDAENIMSAIAQLCYKLGISTDVALARVLENVVAGSNLTDAGFIKGTKYKNQNGIVVEIVEEPDNLGQITYKINNVPKTSTKESFENMLSTNGYKIMDEKTPIDYESEEANDIIRRGTVEEYGAIQAYEPMIMRLKELYNETQNEKYLKAAQDLEEINNEEKKHVGEFAKISADLDPKQSELVQEGMNEVDSATVKDASVADVRHTAEYLWTWVDKAHAVADEMFVEQSIKYRSHEERRENLNPIFHAAMKQLNDYEKALKSELDKMFNEGSALNRQRIKELYDRLVAKKR